MADEMEQKDGIENGDYEEYVTFQITAKDGSVVDLAIIEEFEVDHKNYAVCGQIVGDEIVDDGVYLYRIKLNGDDFAAEKITDPEEYAAVSRAYMEMEEE